MSLMCRRIWFENQAYTTEEDWKWWRKYDRWVESIAEILWKLQVRWQNYNSAISTNDKSRSLIV